MVILVVGNVRDAADDPAQMAAHFRAGRGFARPQNDGEGAVAVS